MNKFRIRIIIALIAVGALLGILYYAIHVWFMMNYGSGPQPVSAAILNVDKIFDFPKGFPADPDAEGRKTIEGVDSDRDGVRDDIQRWIFAYVPKEPKKQMALRQLARSYQESLRKDFDSLEVRMASHVLVGRSIECMDLTFDDELHGYMEDSYLTAKILNTYARTVRFWENQNLITTKEVSGAQQEYSEPCDNR